MIFPAAIAGIALHGEYNTVFHLFDNAYMVCLPVLWSGRTFVVLIKEDNIAGTLLIAIVLPKRPILEPLDTVDTACEFWDHASVDISALISTPRYKADAPFYTGAERQYNTPFRISL